MLRLLAFLFSYFYFLFLLVLYFFLKPPSKAPTAGLAGVMPTFFSSGFAVSVVDALDVLGS
jgi:hypothetical protein